MGQSTIELESKNEIAILGSKYSNVPSSYKFVPYNISLSHITEIIRNKFYNKPSHLVRLQIEGRCFYQYFERIIKCQSVRARGPRCYKNESNAKSQQFGVSKVFQE